MSMLIAGLVAMALWPLERAAISPCAKRVNNSGFFSRSLTSLIDFKRVRGPSVSPGAFSLSRRYMALKMGFTQLALSPRVAVLNSESAGEQLASDKMAQTYSEQNIIKSEEVLSYPSMMRAIVVTKEYPGP